MGQPCKVCQPQPPIPPQKRQRPQPAILVLSLQAATGVTAVTDPCVWRIVENGLQSEISAERKKFWPAVMVQQTLQEDPSQSRRALAAAAKRQVSDEEEEARLHNLQSLHLICPPTPTQLHVPAGLKQFSPFKFILNAAHDTLPHNANLHLWGKKASDTCPLCHADNQNLVHVLNLFQVALNLRCYNT